MRLTASEIGFFEDYDDEEALEVGILGVDEEGTRRHFSIQRSTYDPDEQEVQAEMDSYNVSTERGFTTYGCLRSVRFDAPLLTLEFRDEDAEILAISTTVQVTLEGAGVDYVNLCSKLREILDWGAAEKRPELIGL